MSEQSYFCTDIFNSLLKKTDADYLWKIIMNYCYCSLKSYTELLYMYKWIHALYFSFLVFFFLSFFIFFYCINRRKKPHMVRNLKIWEMLMLPKHKTKENISHFRVCFGGGCGEKRNFWIFIPVQLFKEIFLLQKQKILNLYFSDNVNKLNIK